jgi:hypothetical protein
MSLSDRAEPTYGFATFFSFPPKNFFTFLIAKPNTDSINANWEFSGYFGIFSIVLAVIGAIYYKRRHHSKCLAVLTVIAVTMMLGRYTPVYQLYYRCLPGISTFRIPARCVVIVVFSMAALAGLGVQRLYELPLTRKQHFTVMSILIILFLCLFNGAKVFQIPLASREMVLAICLTVSAFAVLNLIRFKPSVLLLC